MTPSISISMATYNVEAYIEEALKCIINQTLTDIEILCIDDASTDGTAAIIRRFAEHDHRITLIENTKNEGLSAARNRALALASGKYIGFVDGDDLVDKDLFRKAFECAKQNDADMVMWDYITFWNTREIKHRIHKPSSLVGINTRDKIELLQRPAFSCVRLLKLETAKKLQIHFPLGLTRQDIPVHWLLLTHLDKIVILPERLYFYRQHTKAITHQKDLHLFDLATVMDIVKTNLQKENLYEQYKDEFLKQQMGLLYGMYDSIEASLKIKALQIINQRLCNEHLEYLKGANCTLNWQTKAFYLGMQGSKIATLKLNLWLHSRVIYRLSKTLIR